MKIISNICSGFERTTLSLFLILLLPLVAYAKHPTETSANQRASNGEDRLLVYGINPAGLKVQSGTVKPGDTLNKILKRFNVPYAVIQAAIAQSKGLLDAAKMKSGSLYYILSHAAPDRAVRYLIYEKTLLDYIVFDLGNSVKIYAGIKPANFRTRIAGGKIESSLWDTPNNHNLNHELIGKLSEIYAWAIDFYPLRKGDGFKVILEEQYIDDKPVGSARVKAARFDHAEKAYYSFYFEQDGVGNYYDENGKNLQKAFLKAPVIYARITSRFSKERFHPVLNGYKKHLGIDYAAPVGTPVKTVGDGVITKTSYSKSTGKHIMVKHNATDTSQYLHLSRFADGIKPGVSVKQGDVIGYVGRTGLTTGPHLDFRFWKNGKSAEYSKLDPPSGEPVKAEFIDLFNQRIERLKQQLDANFETFDHFSGSYVNASG